MSVLDEMSGLDEISVLDELSLLDEMSFLGELSVLDEMSVLRFSFLFFIFYSKTGGGDTSNQERIMSVIKIQSVEIFFNYYFHFWNVLNALEMVLDCVQCFPRIQ